MKKPCVFGVAILTALLASPWVHAEKMFVRTSALSASGEVVQQHVHLVDLDSETVVPGSVRLPGVVPPGSGSVLRDGQAMVFAVVPSATEGTPGEDMGRSYVMQLDASTLFAGHAPRLPASPGWRYVDVAVSGDHRLIGALGVRRDPALPPEGRLDVFDMANASLSSRGASPARSWPLPGAPVLAVMLRDGTTLVIVCQGRSESETLLHVRDMVTGDVLLDARNLSAGADQFGAYPAGVALSRDGARVFVLTSGYALGASLGEAASWLHILDTERFDEVTEPVVMAGSARVSDKPLRPVEDRACWVATRTPGTGVAYATCVRAGDGSAVTLAHVPFHGVSRPIQIAPAPEGSGVAVAWEDRLEIWPTGQPAGRPQTFKAPIGVLEWTRTGLVLGEGGRIHRIDKANGRPTQTIQLQTGIVSGVVTLPEVEKQVDTDADGLSDAWEKVLGTSPDDQDTDGDGIPDGRDREPLEPSPELILPERIAFHGEAVGEELRSVVIKSPIADAPRIWLDYDETLIPWFEADVSTGAAPMTVTFSVRPASYNPGPGETLSGWITVHLAGTQPGVEATGSPARVEVSVTPARRGVRRVLWIREAGDSTDASAFDALMTLLSAPPHYFTHREVYGPTEEPLDRYTIVALETGAAAQGAMTRQALLDYVAGGGALLLLGGYDSDGHTATLADWLGPIGIHLAPSTLVEGVFSAIGEHEVGRHWTDFEVRDACEVRVDEPFTVVVGDGSGRAIVAQRSYGLGRVIVMASTSPVSREALEHLSNRRFAADLFRWLARARRELRDRDGDRLADGQEDRNNNGRVDPGETDYLNADTDGDGLPDGIEDANRNGVFDEGESSPLNPDSDGDGINDGADVTPLAAAGAPYIASVRPGSGPSEGGTSVLVLGQKFAPRTAVWFGPRLSPSVRRIDSTRLIAVTPAFGSDEGEPVMVRVVDVAGGLEGTMTDGYRYTARSVVRATLRMLEAVSVQYGMYHGSMALQLDVPQLGIGPSTFVIEAEPREAMVSLNVAQTTQTDATEPQVVATRLANNVLRVEVSGDAPNQPGVGLVTVQWVAKPLARNGTLRFRFDRSFVTSRFGGLLNVESSPLTVSLAPSEGRGRGRSRGTRPGPTGPGANR